MPYARMRLQVLPLVLFLTCRIAAAQVGTARLEGVVRDPSGAVVPGAGVSVVNIHTGIQLQTSSAPEGSYIFPSLQPGFYRLSVEATGFRKTVVSDLQMTVGATMVQNVGLEIGAITERIVVRAGAERAQAADAQIAQAVTLRDIDVLPQASRAPIALGMFNPGINVLNASGVSRQASVNGTRQGSTNSKLDGIDVNDSLTPNFSLSTTVLNTDSIEEFRIVTSGGKAEYGRNAGGQIELITRSGTSTWHGNAFEYLRNTVLNANNFFNNSTDLPRPAFIQNRFGGSVGGPILRDRTFIFGNFLGLRTAQQVVRNRTVLTPEAKRGLFRWKPNPSGMEQSFDIVANDPRDKGIDPKVAKILALLPDPNNYDKGDGLNTAGYRFNNPATESLLDGYEDQLTFRVDHNLWKGHRLFFRWSWGRNKNIDSANDARYPGQPNALVDIRTWAFSTGSDWVITPRVVNELRVGYKYYRLNLDRLARLPEPMMLANSWTDPLNTAFSNSREPPVRHITDNLTIARGRHVFKAGAEGRLTTEWKSTDSGIWPDVSFALSYGNSVPSTIGPPGNSISIQDRTQFEKLYNDLLGRMNQVIQTFYSDLKNFQPAGTPRVRNHRIREFAWFLQDDCKLHPRLTLNLGLRYEFLGAPVETNGSQGSVDKAALIGSAARMADLTIQPGRQWYGNDFNNFAPRVGLAWDVAGDGKTAVRASWGVFYDRLIGATNSNVDANTPGFSVQVPLYPNAGGTDIRVSDGIPLPGAPATPELRPPATRKANIFLFSPNLRTGYVQHYSLTLQREIFRNTVIEAGYVGTHGIKLLMDLNFNQPRIYEDFLAAFRELQAFRSSGTPVSPANTLVRIFGTPTEAIKSIGSTAIGLGAAGEAADSMDQTYYGRYAAAGVSDFYLRNYPQFNRVIEGTNDGRSYYDSFQLSLRRQSGALKFVANYTYSKSMDNVSAEGSGFTSPIDNFNVRLNRARSDWDFPHVFNSRFMVTLPAGRGRRFAGDAPRWVDSLIGGWDVGVLTVWQSGQPITCLSGIGTGPASGSSFADYSGDRNIGRVLRKSDGVYWLTKEEISRFSFPASGEIGTGGRNTFRGARFFNVDMSLVKRFKINDRQGISFRAEAYNLFNNVNFAAPNTNLSDKMFGKISATAGNPRFLQMALRYDF